MNQRGQGLGGAVGVAVAGLAVAVLAGSSCVERAALGPATLESASAPLRVFAWREGTNDGREARGVVVLAERGSERWFERAARDLVLEVDGGRVPLTIGVGALEAHWVGGEAGTLSWTASDGSAGLRVDLAEVLGPAELAREAGERAPNFEAIRATGLIDRAVSVGAKP